MPQPCGIPLCTDLLAGRFFYVQSCCSAARIGPIQVTFITRDGQRVVDAYSERLADPGAASPESPLPALSRAPVPSHLAIAVARDHYAPPAPDPLPPPPPFVPLTALLEALLTLPDDSP